MARYTFTCEYDLEIDDTDAREANLRESDPWEINLEYYVESNVTLRDLLESGSWDMAEAPDLSLAEALDMLTECDLDEEASTLITAELEARELATRHYRQKFNEANDLANDRLKALSLVLAEDGIEGISQTTGYTERALESGAMHETDADPGESQLGQRAYLGLAKGLLALMTSYRKNLLDGKL